MREVNLSVHLTNVIGKDIVSGHYPINRELPTETEFCQKYDVSRTVLREAFRMLAAKGMISARPRMPISRVERNPDRSSNVTSTPSTRRVSPKSGTRAATVTPGLRSVKKI